MLAPALDLTTSLRGDSEKSIHTVDPYAVCRQLYTARSCLPVYCVVPFSRPCAHSLWTRVTTKVRQVRRDQKELVPTESDTGHSWFLLSFGCNIGWHTDTGVLCARDGGGGHLWSEGIRAPPAHCAGTARAPCNILEQTTGTRPFLGTPLNGVP